MSVLLLEAGGDEDPFNDVPAVFPLLINSPQDWAFKTVPQEHSCQSMDGNVSSWPRGKVRKRKPVFEATRVNSCI